MTRVRTTFVGCKVSRADAEAAGSALAAAGVLPAADGAPADVHVVMTCGVTREAEKKSRQLVRRLAGSGAPVIVAGCAATLRPEQFAAAGEGVIVVSDVVGEGGLEAVVDGVEAATAGDRTVVVGDAGTAEPGAATGAPGLAAGTGRGERTRFTLKVQDGCAGVCSYCAVRLVRGTPRSTPSDEVVEAARRALAGGCGEVVLSGVDLGSYRDASGIDLAALVGRLSSLPGLRRLRLSSLEPRHLTPPLLDALSHGRVARHLHVPLQSAHDGVLAAMARPYGFAGFRALVEHARERLPGLAVTTDVLVGFPGETDEAFAATLAAIAPPGALFSRVHVFAFSPRPRTAAAALDPLPRTVVRARRDAALAAAGAAQRAAAAARVGRPAEVLAEEFRDGCWRGYSSDYVRYYFTGPAREGGLARVVGERLFREGLKGRVT